MNMITYKKFFMVEISEVIMQPFSKSEIICKKLTGDQMKKLVSLVYEMEIYK